MDSIPIISHDKTIIEVLDKKWKKYLIPRVNILKAKYEIMQEGDQVKLDSPIDLVDREGNAHSILKQQIAELNEDNLTYHWLEIPDVSGQIIIVKKEHLKDMKMTKEETMIMDYYGKKKMIIPGKVCRIAKKYHSTEGKGNENILFKLKDENEKIYFFTKPIVKFAQKKRQLDDETFSLEIADKDDKKINVPLENIRDIDEYNSYAEWCEVTDIEGEKIIVKKMDLQDLKEIYDKNLEKIDDDEIPQEISDFSLKKIHKVKANEEYLKLFPNKYSYSPSGEETFNFIVVNDVNSKKVKIRKSLIEYYINENVNDLALEEEINDIQGNACVINPFNIVRGIIMNYDDIMTKVGPYIELKSQSGNKHLIKKATVQKAIKLVENNNEYINIKDNNNVKIQTSIRKLKEIDMSNPSNIIIPLDDITGKVCYFRKDIIKDLVNKIVALNPTEDCEPVIDYKGEKRVINVRQISMRNSSLKKNY